MATARVQSPSPEAGRVAAALAELQKTIPRGLTLIMTRAFGDGDEARDAVQETLARAVEAVRAARVPEGVELGAFVHGIARHVIADVWRARARTRASTTLEGVTVAAPVPDALQQLVVQEDRVRVARALRTLDPDDRALLHDCFVRGLRLVAIAERDGLPPETIRKRKSRAVARLRERLLAGEGHVPPADPTSVA